MGLSPYTIVVYGSCRGVKLAVLVVRFVWRCHRIKWRAASKDFTSTRRYERLSLEKGLVAPAKKGTEKIHSLLQWREALKRSAMYRARSRSSVCCSCGSVCYREQQTECRLIANLVTHDVTDWLELCTCSFTVTFKCLRMAADALKPRILNSAKIKAHTVYRGVCNKCSSSPTFW